MISEEFRKKHKKGFQVLIFLPFKIGILIKCRRDPSTFHKVMFDHSTEITREIPVYTSAKERLGDIPFLMVKSTYNTYKESKAPGGSNPFNGYDTLKGLPPARQYIRKLLKRCILMKVLATHSIEQFLDNPFIKRKAEGGSGKYNG